MKLCLYRYAHIFFGGFTQRVGRRGNGVYDVFDETYHRWADAETLVAYFPWFLNPADVAGMLFDRFDACRTERSERMRIGLTGYSFGGQTAVNVCRELAKRNVHVDSLVLSDAVACCGRLGWLRAANPFSKIVVPDNVGRGAWFRQCNPRWSFRRPCFHPAGHDVVWPSATKPVFGPVYVQVSHEEMDDVAAFGVIALDEALRLHGPQQPPRHILPMQRAA